MKKIAFASLVLLICSCSDKHSIQSADQTSEAKSVERWYSLQKSVDSYQKLQPDRPILVFFTNSWCHTGTIVKNRLNDQTILDLCSQYRVLPLIADYTHFDSIGEKEREKLAIDSSKLKPNFFLLKIADKNKVFSHTDLNTESLLTLLKQQFEQ